MNKLTIPEDGTDPFSGGQSVAHLTTPAQLQTQDSTSNFRSLGQLIVLASENIV